MSGIIPEETMHYFQGLAILFNSQMQHQSAAGRKNTDLLENIISL
jgi:hypothetical protein